MRCGWDGHQPLLDPMCGSGTLLIEAAMMAANMAPGVKRKQWCFESLEDFEPDTWAEIKSEANVRLDAASRKLTLSFWLR